LNNEIYGNGSIDDLKESISKYGLDQPLIINENNRLLSGHRRLKALQELGYEDVPVQVRTFTDPNHEVEFLIRSNQYRTKTKMMIVKEAETLREIEKKKAEYRKLSNLKNHTKFEDSDLRNAVSGRAEQIIADTLGTNIGLVRNSFKFSDLTKNMKGEEMELYTTLFESNVSGSLEALDLDLYNKIENKEKESLKENPKLLRRIIEKVKLDKYKSRYGVVYATPKWHEKTVEDLTDETKAPVKAITKSKSKLFMLVEPEYIPEALQVISKWGFTYHSNYVWTFEERQHIKYKMLFIAYKGKTNVSFSSFNGKPVAMRSEKMPFLDGINNEDPKAVKLHIGKEEMEDFDQIEEVIQNLVKTSNDTEVETVEGEDILDQ